MAHPSSRSTTFVLLVAIFGCVGCLGGVASARFKGTVTEGAVGKCSFDDIGNPQQSPPVSDAVLTFYVVEPEASCKEAAERWPKPPASTTTTAQGFYDLERYYTGGLGVTNKLLLCVSHPNYKPFYYEAVVGESFEPHYGEKFLNIQLEKK